MALTQRQVTDPVCGAKLDSDAAGASCEYNGRSYYFCCAGCQRAFEEHPTTHLRRVTRRPQGWFGRYLQRLERSNLKAFGPKGPHCH